MFNFFGSLFVQQIFLAMEKAESAVKDASQKVQDAKDKTCKAIGKVW